VCLPGLSKLSFASYHGQCLTDGDGGGTFVLGIFTDPIHDRYIDKYVAGDRIGISGILLAKETAANYLKRSPWFDPQLATNGDMSSLVDVNSSPPVVS
jgi:hypothetical protein